MENFKLHLKMDLRNFVAETLRPWEKDANWYVTAAPAAFAVPVSAAPAAPAAPALPAYGGGMQKTWETKK